MDDDLSFSASVWGSGGSPAPLGHQVLAPPLISPVPSISESIDDEFDDFGTPAETVAASGDEADDDFGDFGDFGDTDQAETLASSSFDEPPFDEPQHIAGPSTSKVQSLRLIPYPPREDLQAQLEALLHPLWDDVTADMFHDTPIRQASGLGQILVTPESRQLYDTFFPPSPPIFEPINWTRSRIRRQHLISLGIPVNLDEVLPPAGGKLPPLEITTRPMSAPPGPKPAPAGRPVTSSTANNSRAGTPTPQTLSRTVSTHPTLLRLGPHPELNEAKVIKLLDSNSDDLSLLSLKTLNSHLESLKEETAQASAVLTYLLQARDALQQDSETYNKLIAEMVLEAQKIKISGGKRVNSRRGSAT